MGSGKKDVNPVAATQRAAKQREKDKIRKERLENKALRVLQTDVQARTALEEKIIKIRSKAGTLAKPRKLPPHLQKKLAVLQTLQSKTVSEQQSQAKKMKEESYKSKLTMDVERIEDGDIPDGEESYGPDILNLQGLSAEQILTVQARSGHLDVEEVKEQRRQHGENRSQWVIDKTLAEKGQRIPTRAGASEFFGPPDTDDDEEVGLLINSAAKRDLLKNIHQTSEDEMESIGDDEFIPPPPPLPTRGARTYYGNKPTNRQQYEVREDFDAHAADPLIEVSRPAPPRLAGQSVPVLEAAPVISRPIRKNPTSPVLFVPTSVRLKGVGDSVPLMVEGNGGIDEDEYKRFLKNL